MLHGIPETSHDPIARNSACLWCRLDQIHLCPTNKKKLHHKTKYTWCNRFWKTNLQRAAKVSIYTNLKTSIWRVLTKIQKLACCFLHKETCRLLGSEEVTEKRLITAKKHVPTNVHQTSLHPPWFITAKLNWWIKKQKHGTISLLDLYVRISNYWLFRHLLRFIHPSVYTLYNHMIYNMYLCKK